VIFIEVALTRGMSAKVQPLLALGSPVVDPASADCAIFYSITNPQEGLRGISFGNLLIKQVAEDLGREFPRLKTFATLSPIPGFRKWLTGGTGLREGDPKHAQLSALLAKLDGQDWFADKARAAEILKQLSRLCAYYLLYAKQDDEPLDPVARFHLGNGARLERLNWLGDISAAGMRRSAGLMVNYVYPPRRRGAQPRGLPPGERRIIACSPLRGIGERFAAHARRRPPAHAHRLDPRCP